MIRDELIMQFKRSLTKADLSQAEAARRIGVGATHLNQILRGKRRPSLELLEKMVAFGRASKSAG